MPRQPHNRSIAAGRHSLDLAATDIRQTYWRWNKIGTKPPDDHIAQMRFFNSRVGEEDMIVGIMPIPATERRP